MRSSELMDKDCCEGRTQSDKGVVKKERWSDGQKSVLI